MAVGLGTGVPWVMCKEDDAPDPVVSEPSLLVLLPVHGWTGGPVHGWTGGKFGRITVSHYDLNKIMMSL
jgi:hypothetical protein